jgi:hypothetical protein
MIIDALDNGVRHVTFVIIVEYYSEAKQRCSIMAVTRYYVLICASISSCYNNRVLDVYPYAYLPISSIRTSLSTHSATMHTALVSHFTGLIGSLKFQSKSQVESEYSVLAPSTIYTILVLLRSSCDESNFQETPAFQLVHFLLPGTFSIHDL